MTLSRRSRTATCGSLGRAARLARLANIVYGGLQRRCAGDWLRIPMDEWCVDSDTDDEGLSDEDWSDLEGPSDDEEWFRNTPAHVRYVSNDELARRAARLYYEYDSRTP